MMKRIAALAFFLQMACIGCSQGEAQREQSEEARGESTEQRSARTQKAAGAVVRVETARITASDAKLELVLPGEIEGAQDAQLAASMGGFVESVLVKNGATVKEGQTLLRVDSASHKARLMQAQVELKAAQRELARAQAMKEVISGQQLDDAGSRVAAARASVAAARVNVDRAIIKAPFAGTIAGLDVDEGEVAAPGAPLIRVVQLDEVKVSISVSDREVVALKEGMTVTVTTGASAKQVAGKITHINPAADPRTRAFEVEVTAPNPDRSLLPGMIAQVRVAESVASKELVIPQDWIVTKLNDLGVFTVVDGVAKWKSLELGRVVRDQVVVKSGLASTDEVVTRGQRQLSEGDSVIVARSGVCCKEGRVQYERAAAASRNKSANVSNATIAKKE